VASTSRNLIARLSRHDIDIILDSDSDEYNIDLHETDEEEDDLTGQPLNPPVGVTKQGGRTNGRAHDRATNDSSTTMTSHRRHLHLKTRLNGDTNRLDKQECPSVHW
jgi:hypothetical protein